MGKKNNNDLNDLFSKEELKYKTPEELLNDYANRTKPTGKELIIVWIYWACIGGLFGLIIFTALFGEKL